jgi:hypothetical protein
LSLFLTFSTAWKDRILPLFKSFITFAEEEIGSPGMARLLRDL